jgi:hypothetical protein
LRVYVIGRNYQATEIDAANAARRWTAWPTGKANPALREAIQSWLWQPPDAGGLEVLAEFGQDFAALQTEIAALWLRVPQQREPDGRGAR